MSSDETGVTTTPRKKRRWRPFHFMQSRPRTIVSLAIFVVTSVVLLASGLRPALSVLLGFDLAALVFLGILARMFNQATPTSMRTQSRAQDTGRWGVLWSGIVLSSVV
ncbi:MAG: DUF1345 domain-containing protein, partial [Rhodanobacter sp.]